MFSACRKKSEPQQVAETENAPAPYDTIPIDSFAVGANPEFLQRKEDSVRQIYLDSLAAVKAKQTEAEKKEEDKKAADGKAAEKKNASEKETAEAPGKPDDQKSTKK